MKTPINVIIILSIPNIMKNIVYFPTPILLILLYNSLILSPSIILPVSARRACAM